VTPRFMNRSGRIVAVLCCIAACSASGELRAQRVDSTRAGVKRKQADTTVKADSTRKPQKAVAVRDSTKPPLSPGRAFLYPFALPGLAQSRLDRGTAGAVYYTYESLSWTMLAKSLYDLRIAKAHAADTIVTAYKVDSKGVPILSKGNPVRADSGLRNRYAGN